ncbi:hypothetical protein F8388_009951 [Cannabis sativa]|uniref:HMA domain-containing protein n=1 Tax=Cannabis sativa TaxID=3483 RepID=A0A7J6ELF7_CANSA|nr:hypothetical protein G4B88_024251 [Cannabis sativa]KAF4389818.1 hypothetical protein F8388_009951 [Cannabis sativa]
MMKRMDVLCSSPASTAICSSIDQRSMVRRSHKPPPTADHHHHHHQTTSHHHRLLHNQLFLLNPKTYKHYDQHQKTRKSCSSSSSSSTTYNNNNNNKQNDKEVRRKSSADIYDLKGTTTTPSSGSSRYLLSEDWLLLSEEEEEPVGDHRPRVVPVKTVVRRAPTQLAPANSCNRSLSSNNIDSAVLMRSTSSSTRSPQVVVLRVSLHCKGCEGKVRKHLSKMEGVRSFSTDLASKKVTVIGDVTPLGVLASVSKVKNAQLWPQTTTPSTSSWSA